ncbi:MAG TPA: FeoC-like transcriptional regulator [Chloroflexaceae bacterium]|nr:FeoC-like transcriptional regulator [Chloroflexaceae bacterium]
MLHQVLQALETAPGPVSLDELSRRLGVERGALEGMIAFWVRKGRLREGGGPCASAAPGCSCSFRPGGCGFDRAAPRTIFLLRDGEAG